MVRDAEWNGPTHLSQPGLAACESYLQPVHKNTRAGLVLFMFCFFVSVLEMWYFFFWNINFFGTKTKETFFFLKKNKYFKI